MKRISALLLITSLLAALVLVAPSVLAQDRIKGISADASVDIDSAPSEVCVSTGAALNLPITLNSVDDTPRSFSYVMSAPSGGQIVAQGTVDFTGPYTDDSQILGISPLAYTLGANTSINLTVTTYSGAGGAGSQLYVSRFDFNCSTGERVDLGGSFVPGAFVLRTIVCDTPVYGAPDGDPVPDSMILAGQSWFVNPINWITLDGVFVREAELVDETTTDTTDQQTGQQTDQQFQAGSWTEIYVASRDLGFIPSECVGFYPGIPGIDVQTDISTAVPTSVPTVVPTSTTTP